MFVFFFGRYAVLYCTGKVWMVGDGGWVFSPFVFFGGGFFLGLSGDRGGRVYVISSNGKR